jgi:hypothetical protein
MIEGPDPEIGPLLTRATGQPYAADSAFASVKT